jgi:hypothetical protein
MQAGRALQRLFYVGAALLIGVAPTLGGTVVVTHSPPQPTSIPGSTSPLIEMNTVTVTNNGTNMTFNITFLNSSVEGPSSGNNDAVYGFFNLDTDKSKATGASQSNLNGHEGGFGQFVDSRLGIDAYISLSSEGDPSVHNVPGLVDLIGTSNFTTIDTVPITYGSSPSSLSFVLPDSDFKNLPGFSGLQAGGTPDFSVVVGNVTNATDVLSSVTPSAVPEPSTLVMAGTAMLCLVGVAWSRRRRAR